jgi:hypothetical protein
MEKSVKEVASLVTNGAMSANITSGGFSVAGFPYVAIQGAFTTTTATGTFSVEASLDNSTWTPLTLSSSPTAAGADGNFLIELAPLCAQAVRLKYTRSAGSGTLNAKIFCKGA